MDYFIDKKIKCIPVFQNQQDFLIGVFSIGTILKFTKYTKRLIVEFDENNIPVYNPEIQRELENSRVQKIADFLIDDPNATFPTNIVLHIPSIIIESQNINNGFVEIKLDDIVFEGVKKSKVNEDSADIFITIIDGQHRIKGIELALHRIEIEINSLAKTIQGNKSNDDLKKKLDILSKRKNDLLNIQLVVSFFIDKTLEYQAMIFSTINRTQKRVSDSLVSSLFGLTSKDSPQKTSLQVVLVLNSHEKSPFYNRVNLYGNDYLKNQSPPLSQATMVKSIINLICENIRESERDRFKDRKVLLQRSLGSTKNLIFRNYYATNNDSMISDILFHFFKSVRDSFQTQNDSSFWDFNPEKMKPTNILQTTVGYIALLEILCDILPLIPEEKRILTNSYKSFTDKFSSLKVNDLTRYPFTSKSKSIFYLDMNLLLAPATKLDDPRILKLNELLSKD